LSTHRANGSYASGQLVLAVLEALSTTTEELDAQAVCRRVRSGPHAPAAPDNSIYKVLGQLAKRRCIQRSGKRGAYRYRCTTVEAAPPPASLSPLVPSSVAAGAPATHPALLVPGASGVIQLGRYLLHPDAWRLVDRGVADQITIYLTTEPRRLCLSRREEPDLYQQACAWANGLSVAPIGADERVQIQARIDALVTSEAEALALAEQYAKELDEVRRELDGLKVDPTKLLALLQSRLVGSERIE